jgi:hypothetical protein
MYEGECEGKNTACEWETASGQEMRADEKNGQVRGREKGR